MIPHPQPCTMTERRTFIQNALLKDQVGAEKIASTIIKQKIVHSQEDSDCVQLDKSGKKLTISKAGPSKKSKFASYQNEQIPASELGFLMSVNKLSLNQVNKTSKILRSWKGRDAIESGAIKKLRMHDKSLQPYFTWNTFRMDSATKQERNNDNKVERCVVYCHDIQGLISSLNDARQFKSKYDSFVKIGIDGGGSFLKFCLSLEQIDGDNSTPINFKKWSYRSVCSSKNFKNLGVSKIIILAIVENVSESYHNLKTIIDLINLSALQSSSTNFKYAFDMKLVNVFLE